MGYLLPTLHLLTATIHIPTTTTYDTSTYVTSTYYYANKDLSTHMCVWYAFGCEQCRLGFAKRKRSRDRERYRERDR